MKNDLNDLNDLLAWALQFNKTAKIEDDYIVTGDDCFDCSGKNLTVLPDNIDRLNVDDFYCCNNRLTKLPDSTCNMKANHFDCSDNDIIKLPDSIGNMKLKAFYCNINQITELPDSIGKMKVHNFYCSGNQITKLPKSIINMKVAEFYCHNNLLERNHVKPNKLIEGIFEDEGYCYLDGIFDHIINIKIKDNVKIIKTTDGFIVTDEINHAHGNDIKSAYLDYKFKISTKDLEQYKLIDINELHSLDYLYGLYRNITGSCQLGMADWISNNNKFIEKTEKSGSSIKELLKITKNNFGNGRLIEFFNL